MTDFVEYSVARGICTITLNRPETLNALTPQMSEQYIDLLARADRDSAVRAVVVTGAGRGFCSGADLAILDSGTDALTGYTRGQSFESLPLRTFTMNTPVITAINGPAAGIGFVLAISADKRFMTQGTSMSATFPRLGLVAEYGVAWLLPRLVGLGNATDLLLTGRKITSTQAAAMGLVDEVPDAYEAAVTWAEELITHSSPRAMAAIKGQLFAALSETPEQTTQRSLDLMADSFTWPDLAEVLRARSAGDSPAFPDL